MDKKNITTMLIGIAIGAVVALGATWVATTWRTNTTTKQSQSMMMDNSDMSMDSMVAILKDKTGDEFDKEFIAQMIAHHQGAIDMAKLIEERAKHDELKQLGTNIISAQTGEIAVMTDWYALWGYGLIKSSTPMNHDMSKMGQ